VFPEIKDDRQAVVTDEEDGGRSSHHPAAGRWQAASGQAVPLFHRGQRAPHAYSADRVMSLPKAVSVDRIGILRYPPTLGYRQYSVLPYDPGIGEELAQAFGDAGGDLAKSILCHVAVHRFMGYRCAETEQRQVLQYEQVKHLLSLGYGHAQGVISGDPAQFLRSGQQYPDRGNGADAQGG
jgi:hypothetical protein